MDFITSKIAKKLKEKGFAIEVNKSNNSKE